MSGTPPMRVLSFSQPWLWAILDPLAAKWIENRKWQPAIEMIGRRFALHAAKSWDEEGVPFFHSLGITHAPARFDLYPRSAIVGVATIARIVTEAKTLPPEQARWFFGTPTSPFGWVLEDVRPLPRPIPFKGAQGLRDLPLDVAAAIERQLATETT